MARLNLTGTYIWKGKKYGPGQGVTVPAELAEWLGQAGQPVETPQAAAEGEDAPAKPARRKAAE